MIATVLCLKKLDYNVEDLSKINLNNFNDKLINDAISELDKIIISYQRDNPHSNLSNIAKSADFTTNIKKSINV